ncbi:MAG: RNA polymerase sigma factor [Betaproteobacteria bacterium]|nr:RNA polymerase sigma factor [Betaproteobacteria bacterium]MDE2623148.1 RNA polymerase sigma factor [Betaproteobacteria bacterium]
MATHQELSDFLASVERRAFKHALYAVRDEAAALDIVQDAMLRLAEKYHDRPVGELPPLFQRILQNIVRDHFRRNKIRSWWTPLFSSFRGQDEEEEFDLLEAVEIPALAGGQSRAPEQELSQKEILAEIEQAIEKLPARQREAFLLRYWEEMDVAETAAAMGCSEGSVKTHCSRAVHALSALLSAKGITL